MTKIKKNRNEYWRNYYLKNKEKQKGQRRERYLKNREKILIQTRKYRLEHKAEMNSYQRIWSKNPKHKEYLRQWNLKNKDKRAGYDKKYRLNHKEIVNKRSRRFYQNHRKELIKKKSEYELKRRRTDVRFMIEKRLRRLLSIALEKYTKYGKTMSSKKYGLDYKSCIDKLIPLPFPSEDRTKWHIDHIRPIKSFDLSDPEQVKECFSSENLQWLIARENIVKGGRV